MNCNKNKDIAKIWVEAFNKKDLSGILSLYHENAQHYSPKLKIRQPETGGYIKGKAAMHEWWRDAFERLPGLSYEIVKLTADEEQVFIEYIRHAANEEDMKVAEVLEIKNGLIVFSRVYHG